MKLLIYSFLSIVGLLALLFLFDKREEPGVPASVVISQPSLIDNVNTTVSDSVQLTEREREKESISSKEEILIEKRKHQFTTILRTLELGRTKFAFARDSEKYSHAAVTIAPVDDKFGHEIARFRKSGFDDLGKSASRKMEKIISDLKHEFGSDRLTMVQFGAPHDESERYLLIVGEVDEKHVASNVELKYVMNAGRFKMKRCDAPEKGWRYEHLFIVEDMTDE